MLDWLLVGALGSEVLPLLWALERPRPVDRRLTVGRLGRLEVGVLRCGVGPRRAERNTRAALSSVDAARVLSLGTCGGLVDGLDIGQVVTVSRLFDDVVPLLDTTPLGPWPTVGCATVAAPVADKASRRRLAAAGAGVCEMEAAAVARASDKRPLSLLKVVSDLAGAAPDLALSTSGPVAIAQFNLRALRLSRDHLTPALLAALRALD